MKNAPHPNSRMNPGGDLYIRPLTRAEMLAPLAWHELQMAVSFRYGELADGSIGHEKVHVAPNFRHMHPDFVPR